MTLGNRRELGARDENGLPLALSEPPRLSQNDKSHCGSSPLAIAGAMVPRKTGCGPSWSTHFTRPAQRSLQLMRTPRLHWLTAGGHSFHPVYDVCAVCGVTRPQYRANGEPKCAGRQSGFERFIEPDDVPDSKGD